MTRNEQLAWAAGIVDGEGSIRIQYRARDNYGFALEIKMCCEKTVRYFRDIFKVGEVVKVNIQSTNKKWRDQYTFNTYGTKALAIIQEIFPFLVTKKEHAKLFIEYYATCSPGIREISQEISIKREIIFDELRMLTKRGV